MKIHEKFIRRCIQIAKKGFPEAMPNPSVGAVIVYKGKIIGEGYTSTYGGAHAEVNAINSVNQKELLRESTLYVSLEPCSHHGKTPPCSDLIIREKIKKVVIGAVDPYAEVAGRGIQKLQNAGHKVITGVLEKECIDINKRFFTFHLKKRPYIILKWAQTDNRYLSPDQKDINNSNPQPFWITNSYSKQLVHKWRAEEQAILVGTNTVINDNPKLNTRQWEGKNPVRIVLDATLRIPRTYAIYDDSIPTIVITDVSNTSIPTYNNIIFEKIDFSTAVGIQICNILYKHSIQSLIVEGGKKTLNTFIKESLWDEARIFTSKKTVINNGLKAPEISGKLERIDSINGDQLKIITNS